MKKVLATVVLALTYLYAAEAQAPTTYTTNFPGTENPISEGGRWISAQSIALDWKDVRTTPGLAFGADASGTPNYNDPTALFTGTWGPNQTVEAKVHSVNQRSGSVYEELEFRLRSAMSAHWNAGYEVNFRCTHDGSQYVEIVRWNGALGSFAYVARGTGPGIWDGDRVKATISGSVITAYINGIQVVQGTDATFASGNPGIGFYLDGIAGANADYGFSTVTATDGSLTTPPAPPTNVRIIRTLSRLLFDRDVTLFGQMVRATS